MVILPWWSVTRTASLERARKASSTPGAPAAPVPIFAVSGGDGGGGEARLIGRRYTGLDAWSGHSSSVPLFLRGAWAHRGALFLADPERPLTAADHGRDGPVQRRPSSASRSRRTRGRPASRSRSGPPTSRTSGGRSGT